MNKYDKVLWEDIIKLISFSLTETWISELAIENAYDDELKNISRKIINPKSLPHNQSDTFDIWNTHIERVLPKAFLDAVEETIDEDRACDIEDYFFYMQKRYNYGIIFNYWYYIFSEYYSNNSSININEKIDSTIISYIKYIEETTEQINNTEITHEWDLLINNLYVPDYSETEDEAEEISYSYIHELINKFVFLDISYDFWSKINEYDSDILNEIKSWAIINYGDETEPIIPIINEEEEFDE